MWKCPLANQEVDGEEVVGVAIEVVVPLEAATVEVTEEEAVQGAEAVNAGGPADHLPIVRCREAVADLLPHQEGDDLALAPVQTKTTMIDQKTKLLESIAAP